MKRPRKRQTKKNKRRAGIKQGFIMFACWLGLLAAIGLTDQFVPDHYLRWAAWGIVALGVVLMAYLVFVIWFSELENDPLRSVEMQILALENELSYVKSDERLNQILSTNAAGLRTRRWRPNNIIYQEHELAESWIFDSHHKLGKGVGLIRFAEQKFPPMILSYTPAYEFTFKGMRVSRVSGVDKNHLRAKPRTIGKNRFEYLMLFSGNAFHRAAKEVVENNSLFSRIVSLKTVRYVALYERYVTIIFQEISSSDKGELDAILDRMNIALELKGSPIEADKLYEKRSDTPADSDLKKLKGKA